MSEIEKILGQPRIFSISYRLRCYTVDMSFIPFFILMVAAVVFSTLFTRFHLPWVLALIAAGVVVGPFGLDLIAWTQTLEFFADIGLIFLMFLAGLQINLSAFRHFERDVATVTIANGVIPFLVGLTIGWLFGFSLLAAVLLGIVFMSSAVAVVIPALEAEGMMSRKVGRTIVSASVINDVVSLLILSAILQVFQPASGLPIWSFYVLLVAVLIGLRYGLPRLRALVPRFRDEQDLFESEVRIIFAMLFGTVVLFSALGLHPIVAGFFSGLVLSDSLTSDILRHKLHTIGYGVFIPIFFISIGMTTDFSTVVASAAAAALVVLITCGSILSKFASGYFSALWSGFPKNEAVFLGFATVPQLSTSLAVVVTAAELELVPLELLSAIVVLSIVSTMVAPLAMRWISVR